MATEPLPIIDPTRCTGCARCVEVCPTQALAQVADKAVLQFPERCTYCTACEDICPENAIALPFIIVMGQFVDDDFEENDKQYPLFRSNSGTHNSNLGTIHDKGVRR